MGLIENSRRKHYAVPVHDKHAVTSDSVAIVTSDTNLSKVTKQGVNKNTGKVFALAKTWSSIYKDIFTFKPKVSAQSARIVKTLGTDFMSRQKLHIEKQQRNVSALMIDCMTLND